MIKIAGFVLALAISHSAFAQNACYDIFRLPPDMVDFAEIDVQHVEQPLRESDPKGPKRGVVTLTGLERGSGNWMTLGSVEYRVDRNSMTVIRLIERPEMYGKGIYSRMIETILQKNLEINTITISLTGTFFKQYREDLKNLEDPNAAVALNPVYAQFASLGFKNIQYLYELSNAQQVFLRLTLSRPF